MRATTSQKRTMSSRNEALKHMLKYVRTVFLQTVRIIQRSKNNIPMLSYLWPLSCHGTI